MHRHGLRRETIDLDRQIWEWSRGYSNSTKSMIQEYAKKLFLEAGITTFKASDGWYRRWRKRWKDQNFQKNSSQLLISGEPADKLQKKKLKSQNDYTHADEVVESSMKENTSKVPLNSTGSAVEGSNCFTNKIINSSSCGIKAVKTVTDNLSSGISSNDSIVLNDEVIFRLGTDDDNPTRDMVLKKNEAVVNRIETLEIFLNDNKQYHKINENSKENDDKNISSSHDSRNNVEHNGFHIPRFSLSSEIFDNYNLLENGDEIFCKNCGDFHVDDYRCNKMLFINHSNNYGDRIDGKNFHHEENYDLNCNNESYNVLFDNQETCNSFRYNVADRLSHNLCNNNSLLSQDNNEELRLNLAISTSAVIDNIDVSMAMNDSSSESNILDLCDNVKNCNNLVSNSNSSNPCDILRTRKKGERYLPQFKSKVIAYTKIHSIKSAAYKFNVYEGTISEWIRAKIRGTEYVDFDTFKNPSEDPCEAAFIKWLGEMRKEQRLFSKEIIRDKLSEIIERYKNEHKQSKKKPSWLNLYFHRLKSALHVNEEKETNVVQKKHIAYPVGFKMEVAMYAEKSNQQAAARVFGVARKRVYEWLEIMKTKGAIKHSKAQQGSNYVTDAAVDKKIWTWYLSQTTRPTSFEVREMGRKLYKESGHEVICSPGWFYRWRKRFHLSSIKSIDFLLLEWILGKLDKNQYVSHVDLLEHAMSLQHTSSFKASRGWAIRFCKRYTKLLQKTPTVDTPLPPVMESNVAEFRKSIMELQSNLQLELENIGTVDEIPIHFIHSGVKKKELLIRRPGFDNCQASIILASLADGRMLPSVLVLKGTCEVALSSTKNVFVFCRKDGCVDKDIILYWLNNIWFQYQSGVSLLITDRYSPHIGTGIQDAIATSLCHHKLFPPGCSSKLQPLGVCVSNLFKEKVEKNWSDRIEWNSWKDDSTYLSVPSHEDILTWVIQTHQEIASSQEEELKTSFQKTLLAKNFESLDNCTMINALDVPHTIP